MDVDARVVSEAILVYLPPGSPHQMPWHGEDQIVDKFGAELAVDLVPIVKNLRDEFFASDAWITVRGLSEMVDVAKREFQVSHPEISADAVNALGRAYGFAYK